MNLYHENLNETVTNQGKAIARLEKYITEKDKSASEYIKNLVEYLSRKNGNGDIHQVLSNDMLKGGDDVN